MKTRQMIGVIVGLATLIVVGFTIYKLIAGTNVGINEVSSIGGLLILFFSTITWGTKEEKDGILQEEELGQRITEKASKISYFLLTIFIFGTVVADYLINGTINIFLLILLGLSMITLPITEFFISRKYQ